MRRAVVLAAIACLATGCGGGGSTSTPDAMPDSTPVAVMALASCPSIVDATVQDSPTMFVPNQITIARGAIVKFDITAEHFVLPNTLVATDPALNVGRGETKCFKFMVSGSYGFLCGVHGFTGTITIP